MSADGTRTVFSTAERLLPGRHERDAPTCTPATPTGRCSWSARAPAATRRCSAASARTATAPGTRRRIATSPDRHRQQRRRLRAATDGTLRQISVGNGAFDAAFVAGSANGDHVLFSTDETDRRGRRRRTHAAPRHLRPARRRDRCGCVTPGTAVADERRRRPGNAAQRRRHPASFSTTEALDRRRRRRRPDSTPTASRRPAAPTRCSRRTRPRPTVPSSTAPARVAWFVDRQPGRRGRHRRRRRRLRAPRRRHASASSPAAPRTRPRRSSARSTTAAA